jgi:ammonia channel protein AmtB
MALKPIVMRTCSKATKYDCLTLCNGILVGLVAISGVADRCQNWGAVLIGSIAALFYLGGCLFLDFYRIDDPLEVFQVHCLGGVWGLFATGFFDGNQGALYYNAYRQGQFMGYQIVGIVVILAWTSLLSILYFVIMRKLHLLRADVAVEEIGFDVAELSNVSEEFLDAVRDQIKVKEEKARELAAAPKQVEDEEKEVLNTDN